MRSILITFGLVLLFISLQAQTDQKLRLDSVVSTATGKFHYMYESNGCNFKAVEYDQKVECNYDLAGHLTKVNTGEKQMKEFKYDSSGLLSRTILSQRNDSLSSWQVVFDDDYSHDKTLNITYAHVYGGEYCIFYFDPSGRILHLKDAVTDSIDFKYNPNGEIESRTKYFKDYPDYIWVVAEKIEYSYDSNRKLITELSYLPKTNPPDGNIILSLKSEYYYDSSYGVKDLFLPYEFNDFSADRYLLMSNKWNFLISYKIDERINYTNPPLWTIDRRIKYYYSDHLTTRTEKHRKNETTVYPNPAEDYFVVDLGNISQPSVFELFDIHGRIVLREEIHQTHRIQVSQLQRGMYIYKIQLQNQVTTGKILLQ